MAATVATYFQILLKKHFGGANNTKMVGHVPQCAPPWLHTPPVSWKGCNIIRKKIDVLLPSKKPGAVYVRT